MVIRTFYRIVRVNPPSERDFWFHQHLGRVLRNPTPQSLDQWAGVSVYAEFEDAANQCRQFPRLGQWIAVVDLTMSIARVERTGSRLDSHHTVWAPPEALLASVAAVRGVPPRSLR